jgi:HNH endonuclease
LRSAAKSCTIAQSVFGVSYFLRVGGVRLPEEQEERDIYTNQYITQRNGVIIEVSGNPDKPVHMKTYETMSNENKNSLDLFELPQIVMDIVDFLQPCLSPYESVIYWFIFRHSIVETGNTFARVSVSRLSKGVGSKFKKGDKPVQASDKAISENLRVLEEKGAIKKVGDTTREGTLYRIFLPEEIEICRQRMQEYQMEQLPVVDSKKEQDYYNIKENRLKIFERDKYLCYKCNKQLTRFNATLDHIQPVSEGGDNSFENLVTCCFHCNTNRCATPISDFITT